MSDVDEFGRPIIRAPKERPGMASVVRTMLRMRETLRLLAESDPRNAEVIRERHPLLPLDDDDTNNGGPAR